MMIPLQLGICPCFVQERWVPMHCIIFNLLFFLVAYFTLSSRMDFFRYLNT
jgi:hypothetical protein